MAGRVAARKVVDRIHQATPEKMTPQSVHSGLSEVGVPPIDNPVRQRTSRAGCLKLAGAFSVQESSLHAFPRVRDRDHTCRPGRVHGPSRRIHAAKERGELPELPLLPLVERMIVALRASNAAAQENAGSRSRKALRFTFLGGVKSGRRHTDASDVLGGRPGRIQRGLDDPSDKLVVAEVFPQCLPEPCFEAGDGPAQSRITNGFRDERIPPHGREVHDIPRALKQFVHQPLPLVRPVVGKEVPNPQDGWDLAGHIQADPSEKLSVRTRGRGYRVRSADVPIDVPIDFSDKILLRSGAAGRDHQHQTPQCEDSHDSTLPKAHNGQEAALEPPVCLPRDCRNHSDLIDFRICVDFLCGLQGLTQPEFSAMHHPAGGSTEALPWHAVASTTAHASSGLIRVISPTTRLSQRSEIMQKDATADVDVTFEDLGLSDNSLSALRTLGFERPSPIQAAFIPVAMTGKDAIGQARTGTGKTAAFVLPVLERIDPSAKRVLAIVLAPTRELSEQVAAEASRLSADHPIKVAVIVGGRPAHQQIRALEAGAQIVVGTPGRIIDLINRGALKLDCVDVCVLDEADWMLVIGFRPDIEKIMRRLPAERQTLLLSATLPEPVERLAQKFMKSPQRVDLSEDSVVVETIEQYYVTVDRDRKLPMLLRVLAKERPQQCLVFVRTKRGADALHKTFCKRLPEEKIAIMHGDLPQRKRDKVIRDLRSGMLRMLIATDVVGRGLDISGISHIINYDIPEYCDDYVHRVGRTGRMSSDVPGRAITFVTREQGDQLTRIEMRINDMLPEYQVEGFQPARPRRPARQLSS